MFVWHTVICTLKYKQSAISLQTEAIANSLVSKDVNERASNILPQKGFVSTDVNRVL